MISTSITEVEEEGRRSELRKRSTRTISNHNISSSIIPNETLTVLAPRALRDQRIMKVRVITIIFNDADLLQRHQLVNTIVGEVGGINSRRVGVENSIPSIEEIIAIRRRRDLITDPITGRNSSISIAIDRRAVMQFRQLLRTASSDDKVRQMKIKRFLRRQTFQVWEGEKPTSSSCSQATRNRTVIWLVMRVHC